ncbi:hypothetical protein AGMMS50212_05540 [Spirochaetia bacterium]|nr:hypothetical protein AGMMS50212_05540 [Spirochaetia bacterium]
MDNSNMIIGIIVIVIVVAIHSVLTYCVYTKKGGVYACFYFFLAPLAFLLIILYIDSNSNRNNSRV